MAQAVREVMTSDPVTLPASTPIREAARKMRDSNIGDVMVLKDGRLCGIVTDRDIVVRAVAEDADPGKKTLGDICSKEVVTVSPNENVDTVVSLMREKAVRRIPVLENGEPVGIISIGDLAIVRDERSVLSSISASPPNR